MKYINIYKITDINRDVYIGSTHSNDLSGLYKRFPIRSEFSAIILEELLCKKLTDYLSDYGKRTC